MMRTSITRLIPIYRSPADNGVFLQWIVEEAPSSLLSFDIERGVSPEGPFDTIITNLKTFYFFDNLRTVPLSTDPKENFNLLSLARTVYYRLTARAENGVTATAVSEIEHHLPKRQALLHRKMQRDLALTFKFNGNDVYVLKRKHWGVRCKKCFDILTKKVTNSKCTSCFGTGFEGGYETPVAIKGRFGAPNSDTSMAPQGLVDTNKLRFICLDYPRIDPYDLIIDKKQNQRFLVEKHTATELRRNMVHQSLIVSELSRDSIEYRIVVNSDIQPMVY